MHEKKESRKELTLIRKKDWIWLSQFRKTEIAGWVSPTKKEMGFFGHCLGRLHQYGYL